MRRSTTSSVLAAMTCAAAALAARAQDNMPRRVPPPPALGGSRLPVSPPAPKPPPPLETTDDPTAALVIDGEKVDRTAYGEALLGEYGLQFVEPFVASWLMERRAKQLNVTVSDAEVKAAVDRQKAQLVERRYHGDERALAAALANSGLTLEGWLEGMKRRMRRDVLAKAVVKADRDASEGALKKEFESRYGPGGLKRKGRYIFVSTQVWTSGLYTQADFDREKAEVEADAKKRAEAVKADLWAGKDFASLARERSEDPMAEKGGDYGYYWKNRFGPDADAKLGALKVGETSDVVSTPRGFIIARATGKQEVWEFKARHVLLSTRMIGQADPATREKKMAEVRAEAERIIADVKAKKRTLAEIASERSDDAPSKSKGGDLGTFQSGTMMPEFEKACAALEKGQVSGPVETPYGVHVIELIDKTRKPEQDQALMSVILCSTEFLKVKERKLKGTIEEKAKALADEIATKLKQDLDAKALDALAKAHSDDLTTKEQGGVIEEPLRPGTPADVERAFRALSEPKQVNVVKGEQGYHVVLLEAVEKNDFDKVKDALAKELREKEPTPLEVREYQDKLRRAAKVAKGKF